jgi:hypothetical protein
MTIEEKRVDYLTLNKSAMLNAETDVAELKMSAVGVLKTQSALFKGSAVALALPKGDATLSWSSASVLAAGNDVHVSYGGGQVMAAGNSIDVRNGGAGIAIAGTVRVDRGGVGLLLARHAEIGEDTRVMLQPTGAAALGVGFGAGLLAALVLCRTCMRRRNGAS